MKKYKIIEVENGGQVCEYDDVYDTIEVAEKVIQRYIEDDNDPREPRERQVEYEIKEIEIN